MSWIAVGITVASTALNIYGNVKQGESAASAANTQADWSLENAKWSREDADQARRDAQGALEDAERSRAEGYAHEDMQRRGSAMQLGRTSAAIGQSGVDPASGSALQVATQAAAFAELDALNIRYEGLMRAQQNVNQAEQLGRQATAYEREAIGHERAAASGQYQARNARQGGYLGAASSALAGASSAYGGYTKSVGPTTAPSSYGMNNRSN